MSKDNTQNEGYSIEKIGQFRYNLYRTGKDGRKTFVKSHTNPNALKRKNMTVKENYPYLEESFTIGKSGNTFELRKHLGGNDSNYYVVARNKNVEKLRAKIKNKDKQNTPVQKEELEQVEEANWGQKPDFGAHNNVSIKHRNKINKLYDKRYYGAQTKKDIKNLRRATDALSKKLNYKSPKVNKLDRMVNSKLRRLKRRNVREDINQINEIAYGNKKAIKRLSGRDIEKYYLNKRDSHNNRIMRKYDKNKITTKTTKGPFLAGKKYLEKTVKHKRKSK